MAISWLGSWIGAVSCGVASSCKEPQMVANFNMFEVSLCSPNWTHHLNHLDQSSIAMQARGVLSLTDFLYCQLDVDHTHARHMPLLLHFKAPADASSMSLSAKARSKQMCWRQNLGTASRVSMPRGAAPTHVSLSAKSCKKLCCKHRPLSKQSRDHWRIEHQEYLGRRTSKFPWLKNLFKWCFGMLTGGGCTQGLILQDLTIKTWQVDDFVHRRLLMLHPCSSYTYWFTFCCFTYLHIYLLIFIYK